MNRSTPREASHESQHTLRRPELCLDMLRTIDTSMALAEVEPQLYDMTLLREPNMDIAPLMISAL